MAEAIEQPAAFVYTERIIENGGKVKIREIVPLGGTPPEGLVRFRCLIQGPIGVLPNNEPVIGSNDFAIDAQTPAEAFKMLPQLLEAAIDKLNQSAPDLVAKAIDEFKAESKPKPEIVVASAIPTVNNGDPRMQFPGVSSQSSKKRRRRSR